MPSTSMFMRGFADELEKYGARAGLKLIRKAVAGGDMARAERLAITPGVLKRTGAGSQIRHLGTGMEGTSTLVAHPRKGVVVRKVYDPKGLSGPEMIKRKAEVGRQLSDSPDAAKFLGETKTRIGPAHFYEHVPGKTLANQHIDLAKGSGGKPSNPTAEGGAVTAPAAPRAIAQGSARSGVKTLSEGASAQMKRLKQTAARRGVELEDLHEGNVIAEEGKKTGKAVDYLPYREGEGTGYNKEVAERASSLLEAKRKGQNRELGDYLEDPRRPGNLMARAFRGAPPLVPFDSTRRRVLREQKD